MKLNNTWIGYFDRTYAQMKSSILSRLGTTVPELNDHTESNPFIIILDVFMGISELLHYYIDNAAREVYLHSARQYASAQKISKLFTYRLKGYSPASVTITFTLDNVQATVTAIPTGTVVRADELIFETSAPLSIPAGELSGEVLAIQREGKTKQVTSDGTAKQRFKLDKNTVDKSVTVSINNIQYTFAENFLLAKDTDTVFTTEIGEDQEFYVVFGSGEDGVIPTNGSLIDISYFVCQGETGNVAPNSIDTISSTVPVPMSVTHAEYATGGSGIETLDSLKSTIPASLRTLNRAVTEQDYKDIAESNTGVSKAFVQFDCGTSVDVYVVPTGLGGATQVLLDSVRDLFYDETRLILLDVAIRPAGRISAKINANIKVLDVYSRSLTTQKVKDNLSDFLSPAKQDISGTVHMGDIYQIIENTEGVEYSEVTLLSTVPEATIKNGNTVLEWERELKPSSVNKITWGIKFISATEYELRKGSSFVGQLEVGQSINFPEVQFKVLSGTYSVGDAWEFTTYPYNGTIKLDEASIITITEDNMNFNMEGGV